MTSFQAKERGWPEDGFSLFNLFLFLEYHYRLCHPTRIGVDLGSLQGPTNAVVKHQTAPYYVEC